MLIFDVNSIPFYIVYVYSGISDIIDGFIARKLNIESDFGRKLDSLSDLLFYSIMMYKIWPYLVEFLPTYVWVLIWTVAIIRALSYLYVLFKTKSLLSNHSILNKCTGLFMFFAPFLVKTRHFVLYVSFVATWALVAAIDDIRSIINNTFRR